MPLRTSYIDVSVSALFYRSEALTSVGVRAVLSYMVSRLTISVLKLRSRHQSSKRVTSFGLESQWLSKIIHIS